ncbi:MAG: hydantoinase/oxoprolinase family protein [Gemmatimonadales bacterium]
MSGVVGWDIGGVNTKAARVEAGAVLEARCRPFEIQREPRALSRHLIELAGQVGTRPSDAHAVTMTAELSQLFRTKREGVSFVLDAVAAAFRERPVRVYTVDGRFLTIAAARREPLAVAAANWAATARLVARTHPDAILIDVGSTTTDIIPIVSGALAARGRTDPERLRAGELVYTGALRTPAEAIAPTVSLAGAPTGVSAEGFALAGDVHLWRGALAPEDYTVPPPDGRPATRAFAGERLARVVCADREMLDDAAITAIADSLAEAQVARIAASIEGIRRRLPDLGLAVVTGLGDFLAAAAARRAGLQVTSLSGVLGGSAARSAPAAAVALLVTQVRGTRGHRR